MEERGKGSVLGWVLLGVVGEEEEPLGKLKGEREEGGVKEGVVAGEGGNWKVEGTAVDGTKVCSMVGTGGWDIWVMGVEAVS